MHGAATFEEHSFIGARRTTSPGLKRQTWKADAGPLPLTDFSYVTVTVYSVKLVGSTTATEPMRVVAVPQLDCGPKPLLNPIPRAPSPVGIGASRCVVKAGSSTWH